MVGVVDGGFGGGKLGNMVGFKLVRQDFLDLTVVEALLFEPVDVSEGVQGRGGIHDGHHHAANHVGKKSDLSVVAKGVVRITATEVNAQFPASPDDLIDGKVFLV